MIQSRTTESLITEKSEELKNEGDEESNVKPFKVVKKRVTFDLPGPAADTLAAYADRTGRSKTEFVRASVGVFALLCDEILEGNRVIVTRSDGKTLVKELILPA